MKLTDRHIAIFGVFVAGFALWYGYASSRQNKEIILRAKEIKEKLEIN